MQGRCALLTEEIFEYTLAGYCAAKTHSVQRDYGEALACNGACVLKILRSRAIGVVLVVPIAHEKRVYVVALFLEQECRDGGVHAPGQADDDAVS